MLKLQGFQTRGAQTIEVFAFYINPLLVRKQDPAALAPGNIANLTLKGLAATRAFLGFVLRHIINYKCRRW